MCNYNNTLIGPQIGVLAVHLKHLNKQNRVLIDYYSQGIWGARGPREIGAVNFWINTKLRHNLGIDFGIILPVVFYLFTSSLYIRGLTPLLYRAIIFGNWRETRTKHSGSDTGENVLTPCSILTHFSCRRLRTISIKKNEKSCFFFLSENGNFLMGCSLPVNVAQLFL